MFTITVASIDRKPRRSAIVTTEGRRHFCWTNKLDELGIEPGGTFNVSTEDYPGKDGTLTNIASAKRVTLGAAAEREAFKSGAYRPPENSPLASPAASGAPFRTPEQLTITEIICAYIANGRCPPEKLAETIGYIRRAWNSNWGEVHREAAE